MVTQNKLHSRETHPTPSGHTVYYTATEITTPSEGEALDSLRKTFHPFCSEIDSNLDETSNGISNEISFTRSWRRKRSVFHAGFLPVIPTIYLACDADVFLPKQLQ